MKDIAGVAAGRVKGLIQNVWLFYICIC